MKVLGIIPARGGSKGVPRKNIKSLGGKPLLWYTATSGLSAKKIDRLILSTDDPEIAKIGCDLGLEVPFLRPTELALDSTPTLPVIQHAIRFLENKGDVYDSVCILQPTNPFREPGLIDNCITKLYKMEADTVFTILSVPCKYNPHWVYFRNEEGSLSLSTGEKAPIPRRQLLPQAFYREGSVYVVRTEVIMIQKSLYGNKLVGHTVSPEYSVNIDSCEDWIRAEKLACKFSD